VQQNLGTGFPKGNAELPGQLKPGSVADNIYTHDRINATPISESYTYKGTRQNSSMGPNDVQLVAKDAKGNDIGRVWYTKEKDGISVRKIEVDPKVQGTGIAQELMRQAEAKDGPFVGATDYTPQGKAFFDKWRQGRK
jgi:predicted GNAT family acetyltransferase